MILLSFFSLYNMQITNFKINSTRTAINLTIIDALNVSTLKLWTDKTYKDYNLAIDLTSKLSGIATENITITLSDLNIAYFDGVYFIEAEDNIEISQAIDSDLTRYKECILNKLIEYSICDDCLKNNSISLINAQTLLIGVENAVEQGFINETFNLINSLNKYCSNDCDTCGTYTNLIDDNYYSSPEVSPVVLVNDQFFDIEIHPTLIGETMNVIQQGIIVETIELLNVVHQPIKIDISKPFRLEFPDFLTTGAYIIDTSIPQTYFLTERDIGYSETYIPQSSYDNLLIVNNYPRITLSLPA